MPLSAATETPPHVADVQFFKRPEASPANVNDSLRSLAVTTLLDALATDRPVRHTAPPLAHHAMHTSEIRTGSTYRPSCPTTCVATCLSRTRASCRSSHTSSSAPPLLLPDPARGEGRTSVRPEDDPLRASPCQRVKCPLLALEALGSARIIGGSGLGNERRRSRLYFACPWR